MIIRATRIMIQKVWTLAVGFTSTKKKTKMMNTKDENEIKRKW